MCTEVERLANRTQVCTVGDLTPGQNFRTQDGGSLMVVDLPPTKEDRVYTVNTDGHVGEVNANIKLGRDRQGRLYASRFLNPHALEQAFNAAYSSARRMSSGSAQ